MTDGTLEWSCLKCEIAWEGTIIFMPYCLECESDEWCRLLPNCAGTLDS